jgi:hypothetical protein
MKEERRGRCRIFNSFLIVAPECVVYSSRGGHELSRAQGRSYGIGQEEK